MMSSVYLPRQSTMLSFLSKLGNSNNTAASVALGGKKGFMKKKKKRKEKQPQNDISISYFTHKNYLLFYLQHPYL